MDLKYASKFFFILIHIYMQILSCTSLSVEQQLLVAENSVHQYRTTVEYDFLTKTYNLYSKSEEIKLFINKTIDKALVDVFNIMSVVDKAKELVTMIQPNTVIPTSDFTEHVMSSGLKQINSIRLKCYEPASALSQKLETLIHIVQINSNYSSPENLRFCLSETHEGRIVSCLEDNVRAYAEFLSRLKLSVNNFSVNISNLELEILKTTILKVNNILIESGNSAQNIANEMLIFSNTSRTDLIYFSKSLILSFFENTNQLLNKTERNIIESVDILSMHSYDLHNNYKTLFSNIQNILNVTCEITLKKGLNSSTVESILETSNTLKTQSLDKLVQYLNDTFSKVRQTEESLTDLKQKVNIQTDVEVLCDKHSTSELILCLYEHVTTTSKILDSMFYLENVSATILETFDENIELKMHNIYSQFSDSMLNTSESLLIKYNIKFKDIVKYEFFKIGQAKKEIIEEFSKLDSKNHPIILDYKIKLNALKILFDMFDKIFQTFKNENEMSVIKTLKELNETISSIYLTGEVNTFNKIKEIETYNAIDKSHKFFKTFKISSLKLSCKNETKKGFSIIGALQCLENERTRFTETIEAFYNDYSQAYTELNNIVSLLFYDIQYSMHNGIKTILTANSAKLEINQVLECLHNVDFRKYNSVRLGEALLVCSFILHESFN